MNQPTEQMQFWQGDFGRDYTERNHVLPQKMDEFYHNLMGVSKTAMNHEFLDGLTLHTILEIGTNVGDQLAFLQSMGYKNLYGVELQEYAVEQSKQLTKGLNIVQGSGFDTPFRDNYFDLVYTHGVLIHISPDDLGKIMGEAYRCSKKYIWGLEYYAPEHQSIPYRGNQNYMWKGNFAQLYLNQFPDLKLVKEKLFPYTGGSEIDAMFLLEKP